MKAQVLSAGVVLLGLVGPAVAQAAQQDEPSQDVSETFVLPSGLQVSLWAESPLFFNPTCMDVDTKGRVWVAEAVNYRTWDGRNPGKRHPDGDRIVILEDSDYDGRADSSKVFAQDPELVAPLGLAVIGEHVYVSASPYLLRYTDADGDDVPESREIFLEGFGGFDHDHGLHSVVAGPDGKLYFTAGNAGPHIVTDQDGWTLRSGSLYRGGGPQTADNKPGLVSDDGRVWTGGLVLRVDPDGSNLEVMAHNFRNDYEVCLDSYGNMFVTDNDDDGNQSCRTTWVMQGANYGFFNDDGSRTWQADRRQGQSTQVAHWHADDPGVAPAGTINGAGGPTGCCVYESRMLAPWIGGAVLNTDAGAGVLYAHKPSEQGAGIALEKTVLLRPKAERQDEWARWFRPSDVVVGNAGEVYVLDWYDPGVGGHLARDGEAYGRILRISALGHTGTLAFEVHDADSARAARTSPAIHTREVGRRFLADMSVEEQLADAVLGEHGRLDRGHGSYSPSGSADQQRIRELRLESTLPGGVTTPRLAELSRHPSAQLRREVMLLLRDVPLEDKLELLLDLAEGYDGRDRWYLEAFGIAADGCEEPLYAELVADFGDQPLNWDARFEGLAWRLHPPSAAMAFAARAMSPTLPVEARRRALDALAFTPSRQAAEAVLNAALSGPEDLRSYAADWIEMRDAGTWLAFDLGSKLGGGEFAGAEQVWRSETVRTGAVDFELGVEGAESVWLVVDDAGDGNSCDWAAWVDPVFVTATGEQLPLTERSWIDAEADWGAVQVDRDCAGGPLEIGETRVTGFGTHAASHIGFAVPEDAVGLRGAAGAERGGLSQGAGRTTSLSFSIWVKSTPAPPPIAEWQRTMLDETADTESRRAAADALARHPQGALRMLSLAREGSIPEGLYATVQTAIHQNPDIGVRALASGLIPRPGQEQVALPSIPELLAMDGDAANGRRVFQDKARAQCSTCHAYQLGDTTLGGDTGPELTRIREKYDVAALYDAILNPNAGIAFGYDTWLVETVDGLMTVGFVLADGANLVLKDTQGERHVIPAEEIVYRRKQTLSTMPEGVALGVEPQQLADLVAFLTEDPGAEPRLGAELLLFDGSAESLSDNWTHFSSDASLPVEAVWSVVDGVLHCEGRPAGYLRSKRQFDSYLLTLEWRFDPERGAGNSGVLLRRNGADKIWPRSIEAQLQSGSAGDFWNIDKMAMLPDPRRTEGRHTTRAQPSSELPLGEWNRYEILVDGPRVELRVNGVLQNAADWCEELPGEICLQSEGAPIQFRDVRLRPIR